MKIIVSRDTKDVMGASLKVYLPLHVKELLYLWSREQRSVFP